MLRGATGGSIRTGGGCTPPPTTPISGREAASPEFTSRLNAAFPRGSDANAVPAGLSTEGFRPIGPCRDDPRIERAGFEQQGGGIAGPYPVSALVAWRRSESGRVEWIEGFVSYRAP